MKRNADQSQGLTHEEAESLRHAHVNIREWIWNLDASLEACSREEIVHALCTSFNDLIFHCTQIPINEEMYVDPKDANAIRLIIKRKADVRLKELLRERVENN